eukprot:s7958_g1.t1
MAWEEFHKSFLKHLRWGFITDGVGRLDCDILGLAELPGIKGHLLEVLFQKAAQHHSLLEKLEDQSAVKEGPLFRSRLLRFLRSIEDN